MAVKATHAKCEPVRFLHCGCSCAYFAFSAPTRLALVASVHTNPVLVMRLAMHAGTSRRHISQHVFGCRNILRRADPEPLLGNRCNFDSLGGTCSVLVSLSQTYAMPCAPSVCHVIPLVPILGGGGRTARSQEQPLCFVNISWTNFAPSPCSSWIALCTACLFSCDIGEGKTWEVSLGRQARLRPLAAQGLSCSCSCSGDFTSIVGFSFSCCLDGRPRLVMNCPCEVSVRTWSRSALFGFVLLRALTSPRYSGPLGPPLVVLSARACRERKPVVRPRPNKTESRRNAPLLFRRSALPLSQCPAPLCGFSVRDPSESRGHRKPSLLVPPPSLLLLPAAVLVRGPLLRWCQR